METIHKNRKELPPQFVNAKGRKVYSTLYGFQNNVVIICYFPKKIIVASLLTQISETKKEGKKQNYNSTKAGVGAMDQRVQCNSTKQITHRWPIVAFYNMIDISALTATILYFLLNIDPVGQRRGNRLCRMLLIKLGKKLAGVEDTQECNTTSTHAAQKQSSELARKKNILARKNVDPFQKKKNKSVENILL